MPVVFDVRAFGYLQAHLAQYGDNFINGLAYWMYAAGFFRPCGKGHVDTLVQEPGF